MKSTNRCRKNHSISPSPACQTNTVFSPFFARFLTSSPLPRVPPYTKSRRNGYFCSGNHTCREINLFLDWNTFVWLGRSGDLPALEHSISPLLVPLKTLSNKLILLFYVVDCVMINKAIISCFCRREKNCVFNSEGHPVCILCGQYYF